MKQVILLFLAAFLFSCSEQDLKEKQMNQATLDSMNGPIKPIIESPKNLKDSIACLCIKEEMCGYSKRNENFKFANEIKEIVVVSYKKPRALKEPILSKDNKKSGVECREEIILNKEQVECLRMILFDFFLHYGPIYTGNIEKESSRTHCILFKNKDGIIIDYIELDFGRYIAEPKDWTEFYMRLKVQTEALELLLKKSGIKHGFNQSNQ